jgi:RES domain-containing protein
MAFRSDGELEVFRIASGEYPVFDGGGAARWGSRWCTPGRNIIHTASAYALALLENLVHWNATSLPRGMRYVVATIPATVARTALDPATLLGWNRDDYRISQPYGDAWYDAGEVAVLVVPSVLSPYEPNVLINQRHPDTRRIRVTDEQRAGIDPRLSRGGAP